MPLSTFLPSYQAAQAWSAPYIARGLSAVILAATDLYNRPGFVCQIYGFED